ncbi:hypothetical protein UPYG_G00168440 [Umbra pygmaea]|uniref:Uncharacterized protein n=1 Tax=Umbra pygmaea TaxID=75934 RepID=A0ABD0XDF9_UMBPY
MLYGNLHTNIRLISMETQPKVEFRNVGQMYFPQSRVECHYSLSSEHNWNNNDWIGLFKAGWTSVKEYSTFAWALTPEEYTDGANANCCVHFQASYLPRPSQEDYQFVYVDHTGNVCARSRLFTFSISKPFDELETLTEEQEEGEGEDLLLVVSRAQLLQTQLEQTLREQAELKKAQKEAEREKEREEGKSQKAKVEWERDREKLKQEISDLEEQRAAGGGRMEEMNGETKKYIYI